MKSTKLEKPEYLFKIGDYFTGVDRTYLRSLYEFLGKNDNGTYRCRHLFLRGRVGMMEFEMRKREFDIGDYRLATEEEVKTYMDKKMLEPFDKYPEWQR